MMSRRAWSPRRVALTGEQEHRARIAGRKALWGYNRRSSIFGGAVWDGGAMAARLVKDLGVRLGWFADIAGERVSADGQGRTFAGIPLSVPITAPPKAREVCMVNGLSDGPLVSVNTIVAADAAPPALACSGFHSNLMECFLSLFLKDKSCFLFRRAFAKII
jgi:hypothetical protein